MIAADSKGVTIVQQSLKGRFVDDQKFGDVTIQIGSRRFLAYKGILSARSPVFASMFEHQMQENIGNSVSISDIKPDVFKELLHYIYTDQLTGLDAVIPDLYAAADKYAISSLKDRCRQHILQKLSWKTGAETLMLADTHQDPEMKKQVLQFFSGSVAGKVTESAGWRKMARTHPYLVDETVKALAAKVRVCEQ
ncbi:hypothetical protein pipiens_015866 [Culex pipiens pipiens]|uniref:BTB domain-containing protein n=1 Tax=Culex pipiens pipiens TaxID=38569 RepID=A0ABD1CNP1_CULPP